MKKLAMVFISGEIMESQTVIAVTDVKGSLLSCFRKRMQLLQQAMHADVQAVMDTIWKCILPELG